MAGFSIPKMDKCSRNLCAHYGTNPAINTLLLSAFRVIYVHAERQTTKNLEGKDHDERILESAGIDYTAIKTWDDFHEAGKTVLEKTGKPMIVWESAD